MPDQSGNSGGALVSLRGELVGLNTASVGPTSSNIGMGFANPVDRVRDIVNQLVKYGEVPRGSPGVSVRGAACSS
jgi:S1-C subfamily serine protease